MSLDFKVELTVENREIHTIINGKRYIYTIDGALYEKFWFVYSCSPGKALNFLKEHCKAWERG